MAAFLGSLSSFQLGNNQSFRDPLTIAISFMPDPDQFRGCCTYTNAVVQQALEQDGGSWVKVEQFTFKIPLRSVPQPVVSWPSLPLMSVTQPDISCFRRCKQVVFKDLPELTVEFPADSWLDEDSIGSIYFNWLSGCTALESVSFESLSKLQSFEGFLLQDCTSLKQVGFKDLPELTEVKDNWLFAHTALESATFESLPKLKSVEDSWLAGCTALKQVVFQGLPQLTEVGRWWLDGCTSLKQVVFRDLPELTKVGKGWLQGCTALETVTFAQIPKLKYVGDFWLADCSRLEHPILQGIGPSLSFGAGYLQGCTALQAKIPELSATDLEIPSQMIPRSTAPGSTAPTFTTTTEDGVLLEHTNENSTLTAADLAQHLGAPSPHDPPPSASDPTTVSTQSGESSSAYPSAATTVCNDQQVGPRMRAVWK